jgi:hypothetical protein
MPEATTVRDLDHYPTRGARHGTGRLPVGRAFTVASRPKPTRSISADRRRFDLPRGWTLHDEPAQAAPVLVSKQHLARTGGVARAIVVNSGCANACTGDQGMSDAKRMATDVAAALGCDASEVLVASTGVIGVNLKMDRVARGIQGAIAALARNKGSETARAIMTTDPFPKEYAVTVQTARGSFTFGGTAKGSGMIEPTGDDAGVRDDRCGDSTGVAGPRLARSGQRDLQRHHGRWRVLDERLPVRSRVGRERRHDR